MWILIVNVFIMFNAKNPTTKSTALTFTTNPVPNTESLRALRNFQAILFPLQSGIECKYKSTWLLQSRIQTLRKKPSSDNGNIPNTSEKLHHQGPQRILAMHKSVMKHSYFEERNSSNYTHTANINITKNSIIFLLAFDKHICMLHCQRYHWLDARCPLKVLYHSSPQLNRGEKR